MNAPELIDHRDPSKECRENDDIAAIDARHDDPRKGLPSASGMQRIIACPGSLPLTEQLRSAGLLPEDRGSKDSDSGTRAHAILAALATGADLSSFDKDSDEWRTAETLWDRAQAIIAEFFGDDLTDVEFVIEERLWLQDWDNARSLASGQFDLIGIRETTGDALVIDYKTLFGEHPPANQNWQLRMAAVLVAALWNVSNVRLVLIQTAKATTMHDANALDCEDWHETIVDAISQNECDPFELGFRTGHHCEYCPARTACPKIQADLATVERTPQEVVHTMPDETLGQFLNALESFEIIAKAARQEADWRLRNGRSLGPDWKLAASPGRRQITDPAAVARALISEGADTDKVLASMTMPVGKAEALLGAATGLKGLPLKRRFEETFDGFVIKTEPEATLKRA